MFIMFVLRCQSHNSHFLPSFEEREMDFDEDQVNTMENCGK